MESIIVQLGSGTNSRSWTDVGARVTLGPGREVVTIYPGTQRKAQYSTLYLRTVQSAGTHDNRQQEVTPIH
jgi:hypothetical protein